MNDRKNMKVLVMGAICIVIAAFRLGGPFLDETASMRDKSEKLQVSIDAIRQEAAMFGKGWEETMKKRENSLVKKLPDYLRPSDVLSYFLAKFEEQNPGRAWFLGVNYQRASKASIFGKAAKKGTPLARAIRYRIKAELAQDRLVPYVEHMEKFESLFKLDNYKFEISKGRYNALEADLTLDFYLNPKEWVPPGVKIAPDQDPALANEADGEQTWTSLFSSGAPSGRKVAAAPTRSMSSGKLPKIDKIIGTSIISRESIFEEGDTINGWKIKRVDPKTRKVILKWGSVTKEVRVQ